MTTVVPHVHALPFEQRRIRPPQTWTDGHLHFLEVMRSPWYRLVASVQDAVVRATVEYGHLRGLQAVTLPITTRTVTCPSGLGSDSRPVPVDVSGVSTYLSDSAQFLLEYTCRMSPKGCYTILPSLRAEKPDQTHLSQFVHSEAEIVGDLDDLIVYVNGYVRRLAAEVLDSCGTDLVRAIGDVSHVERVANAGDEFRRITFAEAAGLLEGDPRFVSDDGFGRNLTRAGEQRLMDLVGEFVWVTHFDHTAVPFYQAFGEDEKVAVNADLFFGVGEVVGSGQRHATGEQTRRALELHEIHEEDYAWYVKMKDIAPLQSSGFGMGVERFVLWVLRHDDIRDIPLVSRIGESAQWPDSVDQP